MQIDILTLFPEYFASLNLSLIKKAQDSGIVTINTHNIRDWAEGVHKSVDDSPAGGGAGMVMKPDVLGCAIDSVLETSFSTTTTTTTADTADDSQQHGKDESAPLIVFTTPRGEVFKQKMATELALEHKILFVCGRYEGIDERVYEYYSAHARTREISIGDYVLAGGEVAALAIIEATTRLLDGVMHNKESLSEESHSFTPTAETATPILEYPLYTQPRTWRDLDIPEVLLSGNHKEIATFRAQKALEKTASARTDLLPFTPALNSAP
jgi:tRNA (guanine37-N1)-methyltransferase